MEQLVLVLIILGFSILEAVSRRRKQGQGGAETEAPPVPGQWEQEARPEARPRPLPSYDDDPSFDDAVEGHARTRTEEDFHVRVGDGTTRAPRSSEDLIPRDIWEEIAALARGEAPTAPRRPPAQTIPEGLPTPRPVPRGIPVPGRPERPGKVEVEAKQGRAPASTPARRRASHPVHATHPQMGRPVSERLTPAAHRPASGPRPNEEVTAVRKLLAGGSASLRQAVILQEILGPPASGRGDPYDPDA
jgi:hypothetical protein